MNNATEAVRFLADILGGPGDLLATGNKLQDALGVACYHIQEATQDLEDRIIRRLRGKIQAASSTRQAASIAKRYAKTCRLPGVSAELRGELIEAIDWKRVGRALLENDTHA